MSRSLRKSTKMDIRSSRAGDDSSSSSQATQKSLSVVVDDYQGSGHWAILMRHLAAWRVTQVSRN